MKTSIAPNQTPKQASAHGCPPDFLDNQFVYVVISSRIKALSVGVNMIPEKRCNFDCIYCYVDWKAPSLASNVTVDQIAAELQHTVGAVESGALEGRPCYSALPKSLLEIRQIELSGDGEPTLSPIFRDTIETIIQLRSKHLLPPLKLALITNASQLDQPEVQDALALFTQEDEIVAKLDAGSQEAMDKINRAECSFAKIFENLLEVGRVRPIVIQSLFPQIAGQDPPASDIEEYLHSLEQLKAQGAQISFVQISSVSTPSAQHGCTHVPLKTLSQIARAVRKRVGLKSEIF